MLFGNITSQANPTSEHMNTPTRDIPMQSPREAPQYSPTTQMAVSLPIRVE